VHSLCAQPFWQQMAMKTAPAVMRAFSQPNRCYQKNALSSLLYNDRYLDFSNLRLFVEDRHDRNDR
jgi:hypothetical protein